MFAEFNELDTATLKAMNSHCKTLTADYKDAICLELAGRDISKEVRQKTPPPFMGRDGIIRPLNIRHDYALFYHEFPGDETNEWQPNCERTWVALDSIEGYSATHEVGTNNATRQLLNFITGGCKEPKETRTILQNLITGIVFGYLMLCFVK